MNALFSPDLGPDLTLLPLLLFSHSECDWWCTRQLVSCHPTTDSSSTAATVCCVWSLCYCCWFSPLALTQVYLLNVCTFYLFSPLNGGHFRWGLRSTNRCTAAAAAVVILLTSGEWKYHFDKRFFVSLLLFLLSLSLMWLLSGDSFSRKCPLKAKGQLLNDT